MHILPLSLAVCALPFFFMTNFFLSVFSLELSNDALRLIARHLLLDTLAQLPKHSFWDKSVVNSSAHATLNQYMHLSDDRTKGILKGLLLLTDEFGLDGTTKDKTIRLQADYNNTPAPWIPGFSKFMTDSALSSVSMPNHALLFLRLYVPDTQVVYFLLQRIQDNNHNGMPTFLSVAQYEYNSFDGKELLKSLLPKKKYQRLTHANIVNVDITYIHRFRDNTRSKSMVSHLEEFQGTKQGGDSEMFGILCFGHPWLQNYVTLGKAAKEMLWYWLDKHKLNLWPQPAKLKAMQEWLKA